MKLPNVWRVACHTKHIGKDSTFVAIKGQNLNGVDFISYALARGSKKIVVSCGADLPQQIKKEIVAAGAHLEKVPDARRALAQLSAQAYEYPSRSLKIIAITGTKGKTTTASILFHMLQSSGYSVALLGTVQNKINSHCFDPNLTTPQPDYLHMFFAECIKNNVEYVVMEVAAQASTLHRIEGIDFDVVVFTNFSQEHGEFYENITKYFKAKLAILRAIKSQGTVILNADDEKVAKLKSFFDTKRTFSLTCSDADVYLCVNVEAPSIGGDITIKKNQYTFCCPSLIGEFNGANIAAAISVMTALNLSVTKALAALETLPSVSGRLEKHTVADVQFVIDYAHTPESYELVLQLLRKKTDHLTVIFGAGGDRDISKRPRMGSVAARISDVVILTTDNPRTEDPLMIISDILSGIEDEHKGKVLIELNREEAIRKAFSLRKKNSIIALLGKGPDEYQIIGNEKFHFSEKAIIKQLND